MNSREIAEVVYETWKDNPPANNPDRMEKYLLAKAHLALLDKLKNPSDEMIDAAADFFYGRTNAIERTRRVLTAANAVLLKEVGDE